MPNIDSELVQAILAIIAGIVILISPRFLTWGVAIFLLLYGLSGIIGQLFGTG